MRIAISIPRFERRRSMSRIKGAVIERIARATLARIAYNEVLWQHFTNKAALAGFWAKPEAERQTIWGPPVDPMVALAEFDERYLSAV